MCISRLRERIFSWLLLFALQALSCPSVAASFDCSKATGFVEKAICSDAELSRLDVELSATFQLKKALGLYVSQDQRTWLNKSRNACNSLNCIRDAYIDRIAQLGYYGRCPEKPADVLGSWVRVRGEGFEEFSLSGDNGEKIFSSWRHHRPEMNGNWVISSCEVHIIDKYNEKLLFDFEVLSFGGGKLVWQESGIADSIAEYKVLASSRKK